MSVNKVNKTTGDLSLLAGGTLYADNPIGSIIPYGGATAPAGWFICDGTELVRATYPELFAVIGTSFGTPSDNTKFKLPDLRGKFVEGVPISGSVGANISAGLPNITGQLGYLKALSSGNYFEGINERVGAFSSSYNLELDPIQNSAINSGGETTKSGLVIFRASDSNSIYGGSDTVQPPSVCVNYIIKAVSVGVPADFMSAVNNLRTTVVAEPTALSNIGTSANATQHDVNVAVDDTFSLLKVITKKGFSVAVPAETSTNNSWLVTVHSKEIQTGSLGAAFVVRYENSFYISNISLITSSSIITIQEDGDNVGQIKTNYTGLNYENLMNWNFKPMGKFELNV